MDRKERIETLISRLCGFMTNEVRLYQNRDFNALRDFAIEAHESKMAKSLEETVNSLRVEAYLKPIILIEMKKIIHQTAPSSLYDLNCGDDIHCRQFLNDVARRSMLFAAVVND